MSEKLILIADDAAFMRKMIRSTLTSAGYSNFIEAANGAEAVKLFAAENPDLVLLDVTMDVAQSVVTSLGGSVSISSRQGYGSSIKMEVPVSMTSSECIRFSVGPYTCLIPIRTVVRVYSYAEAESYLQTIDGHTWFQTEEMLPVIDMFALYGAEMIEKKARLIYIKDEKGSAALLTGPIAGQQTAVEKPLPSLIGQNYRKHTGMSGCTITETGSIGIMSNQHLLCEKSHKTIAVYVRPEKICVFSKKVLI